MSGFAAISGTCDPSITLAWAQPALATPTGALATADQRVFYKLNAMCSSSAHEWYKRYWSDKPTTVNGDFTTATFVNHYNAADSHCYAVVSVTATVTDPKTRKVKVSESRLLADVIENRDIGSYFKFADMDHPMDCHVNDVRCRALEEWTELASGYLQR